MLKNLAGRLFLKDYFLKIFSNKIFKLLLKRRGGLQFRVYIGIARKGLVHILKKGWNILLFMYHGMMQTLIANGAGSDCLQKRNGNMQRGED